jgi:hypothetical protein
MGAKQPQAPPMGRCPKCGGLSFPYVVRGRASESLAECGRSHCRKVWSRERLLPVETWATSPKPPDPKS